MTENEFHNIKNKVNQLQQESVVAETKMNMIREQWMKDYGFDDLDSAKKQLQKEKEEITDKTEKRNQLMNELEKLFEEYC